MITEGQRLLESYAPGNERHTLDAPLRRPAPNIVAAGAVDRLAALQNDAVMHRRFRELSGQPQVE